MFSFPEVYEKHQHLAYNLCLNYLQNRQEAEEAAQDVFVKVHAKLPGFEGKSSLKTWIYRIAVNHCLDVLKARKRQKRFAFITGLFGEEEKNHLQLSDFNHPGVLLEDRESLETLFGKINRLPDNQKTALLLRYLDDLPQREIAEVMQLSEKAVESLLQRAKQQLRKSTSLTDKIYTS
jgi:RNA polymerase sigma-70 factor (ECF subfamily)